jgi:hypothetical protein
MITTEYFRERKEPLGFANRNVECVWLRKTERGRKRERKKERMDLSGALSSTEFLSLDLQTLTLQRIPKKQAVT